MSAPRRELAKLHNLPPHTVPSTLRPVRVGQIVSLPRPVPFDLTEEMMNTHMCVLGVSGGGKSKFLELFLRRLLIGGERGVCLIDPHGDTAEDLMAYAAHRYAEKDPAVLDRIHYVYPGKGIVPRYDPFRRPKLDLPRWGSADADEAWLQAKADRLAEVLQLNQGQDGFESMPRLQRVLRNCLYACGKIIDGRHLPVADALVILDIYHPRHQEVFDRIAPHLDPFARSDFAVLHGFKRASEFRQETESTFNRLRTFLAGIVPAMFTAGGEEPSIDWHKIVRSRGVLLVNLRETDFFSRDQKSSVGKLFIHEILTAIANTPRRDRRPFNLVVDEAGEFLCEDLRRALGAVRKYKLSITLAGQDLSTFQSGKVDLTNKVLSQCGTVVCFQQQSDEDLEVLQPRLGRGNYDFTKLYTESQFNDGYDVEEWTDHSEGVMQGSSRGTSGSEGSNQSWGESHSRTESRQESWSDGTNKGDSTSESTEFDPVHGFVSQSSTTGRNSGISQSYGGGTGTADSHGTSSSRGTNESRGWNEGTSDGKTSSVTRRKVMIPKFTVESRETGSLLNSIADQAEQQKGVLFNLDTGEAVVKCRHIAHAFIVRTDVVKDVFPNARTKFEVLDWFEGLVVERHPYQHVPVLQGGQDARLDAFLGIAQSAPAAEAADVQANAAEKNPYGD